MVTLKAHILPHPDLQPPGCRGSFSIVAAVELDDASHLRPERRRRDILLEEVLRQAGIPLLRSHDARKLLQMTGEWLNTTGADQQSPEHRS